LDIIPIAVEAEAIMPICVPENPILLRYWAINGNNAPMAPKLKIYIPGKEFL